MPAMRAIPVAFPRRLCFIPAGRAAGPSHRVRMPNLLIPPEVQESMRARYKQMLLERFPQLTINVVGHHSQVDPYIADTDILLCFSPPTADPRARDATQRTLLQALGT